MNTGYIFNFKDHGAFSPDGKVAEVMPQTEIDTHNRKLAAAEIEAMKQTGRAVLYLSRSPAAGSASKTVPTYSTLGTYSVGTWEGSVSIPVRAKSGKHNIASKRLDVWFNFDGSRWHGVNIGDNDIVRCRRTKGGAK